MENRYQSEALQAVHEDMQGMYQLGIIDAARMREFDDMCLVKEPEPEYKTDPSEKLAYAPT